MTEWNIEQTRPIMIDAPRSRHAADRDVAPAPNQWLAPNPAASNGPEMIYAWGAFVALGLLIVLSMFVLVVLWS